MSYLDLDGLSHYTERLSDIYADKTVVESLQSQAELFNPLIAYRFEKQDGTLDTTVSARSSATDYSYNMTKNLASHGRRYFALANKTFDPGVYTLSAYITLASSTYNRVAVGIGRTCPWTQKCWLMTEKGGTIRSTTGAGWINYTFVITGSDVPWSFMIEAINSESTNGTMTNVSLAKVTARDDVARNAVDEIVNNEITVSGSTPSITAVAGKRYVCSASAVTTLSFTPCQSGLCEVIFTSGATATTLTIPSGVKMPSWWTGVQANRVYDLMILNGLYGAVMSWTA